MIPGEDWRPGFESRLENLKSNVMYLWCGCAGLSGNISENPRNLACYLVTVHKKNHIEDIGFAVLLSKSQDTFNSFSVDVDHFHVKCVFNILLLNNYVPVPRAISNL